MPQNPAHLVGFFGDRATPGAFSLSCRFAGLGKRAQRIRVIARDPAPQHPAREARPLPRRLAMHGISSSRQGGNRIERTWQSWTAILVASCHPRSNTKA
jgi:hypothetical protein